MPAPETVEAPRSRLRRTRPMRAIPAKRLASPSTCRRARSARATSPRPKPAKFAAKPFLSPKSGRTKVRLKPADSSLRPRPDSAARHNRVPTQRPIASGTPLQQALNPWPAQIRMSICDEATALFAPRADSEAGSARPPRQDVQQVGHLWAQARRLRRQPKFGGKPSSSIAQSRVPRAEGLLRGRIEGDGGQRPSHSAARAWMRHGLARTGALGIVHPAQEVLAGLAETSVSGCRRRAY